MNRFFQAFLIIVSGEAIFMLPFLIPRLYRPLMLEAWSLNNTDIGIAFAAYGITSTLSYLLGGSFADKYNPKSLISISLLTTALSVIYMVFYPSPLSLVVTYAFLGVSTVLLMWGALIKTTHVMGGEENRSAALGILDSGRGLAAAAMSAGLIVLVSFGFSDLRDHAAQVEALQWIYFSVILLLLLLTAAVWTNLNNLDIIRNNESEWSLKNSIPCLKDSRVWLLSLIILSSYCGYKGIDNYSIYLTNIHHLSLERSSQWMSVVLWLRPLSTIGAGFFADFLHRRFSGGRFLALSGLLFLSALSQLLLAFAGYSNLVLAFAVIISSVTFVYGLRAIYFSIFGDLNIQNYLIGTTVGIVSFVGFLPDIFFGYVSGRLIDAHPGELGFRYTFLFTAICLIVGAVASRFLKPKKTISPELSGLS